LRNYINLPQKIKLSSAIDAFEYQVLKKKFKTSFFKRIAFYLEKREQMDLPTPQLIDLKAWCPSSSDEVPSTCSDIWEIFVPEESSLVWSIILAWVASFRHHATSEIKLILEILFPEDSEEQLKKIKEIELFNPFENRNSLFMNERVKEFIKKIEAKLRTYVSNVMENDETSRLTEAASEMLFCHIKVLRKDSKQIETITSSDLDKQSACSTIVIFERHMNSPNEAKFSFGMDIRYANPLRKAILEIILKEVKNQIGQEGINIINKVTAQDQQFKDNFLISLIKSSQEDLIVELYKSPYIVWRLADAGFNTNPCVCEHDRKSAFFYCFELNCNRLLYVLYNYAINSHHRSRKSVRNPNIDVLNALEYVGRQLESDYGIIDKHQLTNPQKFELESKTWLEIFQFNKYQQAVIRDISEIEKPNSKKEIIKCVLKNYADYFYIQNKKEIKFDDYLKYSNYHEDVDNFTGLAIFDNILYFNPTKTPEFTDAMFCLVKCILSYAKFRKCGLCNQCKSNSTSCDSKFIPFNYRLEFLNKNKKLLSILESDSDGDFNDPDYIMRIILQKFDSYTEINDEFAIKRLERYLEVARKESSRVKKVLTIKRALQVLGETLIVSKNDTFGKMLLRDNLPVRLVNILCGLRNDCFSHYEAQSWLAMQNLEDDAFLALQSGFEHILIILRDIISIQGLRVAEFLIENCKFQYASESEPLRKSISNGEQKIGIYFTSVEPKLSLILSNAISALRNKIKEQESKKSKVESYGKETLCLKYLHDYILKRKFCDKLSLVDFQSFFDFLTDNNDKDIDKSIESQIDNHLSNIESASINLFGKNGNSYSFDYSHFENLHNNIKNFAFFSLDEIAVIKQKCLDLCKKSEAAKENLERNLTENSESVDAVRHLDDILMPKHNMRLIKQKMSEWSSKKIIKELNKATSKIGNQLMILTR
ncbi:hypothetical protein CDAR_235551, partial [Caerostris darwini]